MVRVPSRVCRVGPRPHPISTSQNLSTLVTSALEPSRVVRPVRVKREDVVDPVLLARVEAVEWWRRSVSRCDLVAAWFSDALAWVQIASCAEQAERVELCGWID